MKRAIPGVVILLVLIVAVYFYFFRSSTVDEYPTGSNFDEINGQRVFVGLADTPAQRAQGLSGRDSLAENTGLLFVFDRPGRHGFWMKDMKFSLDIIWIMDDTIVDIWPNAPSPTKGNILRYAPKSQANYVLEVNSGFAEKYNIKVGDSVSIDLK